MHGRDPRAEVFSFVLFYGNFCGCLFALQSVIIGTGSADGTDRKEVSAEMEKHRSEAAGSSEEKARLEKQIRFIAAVVKVKKLFLPTCLEVGIR